MRRISSVKASMQSPQSAGWKLSSFWSRERDSLQLGDLESIRPMAGARFVGPRLESLSQPALGLYLGIIIGERGYLDPTYATNSW